MGPKISVDSATLMNKGLEVIEAHHLFGVPGERIDVLVHPQSLVHSLVEFVDGSTLAQMGLPDMRTTLAVGLGWPHRIESGVGGLDLLSQGRLDFEAPDTDAFPCLGLAWQAMAAGGTAPAVLNAANEVAVSAFLQGRAAFLAIPALVANALSTLSSESADTLEGLLTADQRAALPGTGLDHLGRQRDNRIRPPKRRDARRLGRTRQYQHLEPHRRRRPLQRHPRLRVSRQRAVQLARRQPLGLPNRPWQNRPSQGALQSTHSEPGLGHLARAKPVNRAHPRTVR
jgi:hypothetical protein